MARPQKILNHHARARLHTANIADDPEQALSDTESEICSAQSMRRRRLGLTWSDGHTVEWHRDVRLAECLVRDLATRIASAQIPAAVCRQRWSPLIVPLLWGAAGEEETTPVFQWWTHTLSDAPQVELHGNHIGAEQAVQLGWSSLKESLRMGASQHANI